MSVSPVAKFSVLKSHKVVASAIIFGLSLAAYSCAGPKDPAASKSGSVAAPAPATNATTAEQYQSFAPVFLANLESALTVAKVPPETVTKIMSEIKSPVPALGLAASAGASQSLAGLMSAVLEPTQKNVPALSLVTVQSFVAVLAISVAQTLDSSLASAIAAGVGISPEQLGADSAVRAALVLGQILNNNPVTPVQGNLAAYSPESLTAFLSQMGLVPSAEVDAVCPGMESSSEAAALGLAGACSSKATNELGSVGKTPGNKFLLDGTAAKCLGAGVHVICFKKPTVGADKEGAKTFDACIKCANSEQEIPVNNIKYPVGAFNCAIEKDKDAILQFVTDKLKEEAKKCSPMPSSVPSP